MLNSNQTLLLIVVSAVAGAMCTRGIAPPEYTRMHDGDTLLSANTIAPRADTVALLLDDSAITATVEDELANEFGMAAHAFHVDTRDSVVTRSGNVDSVRDHDIALQIVGDTIGVRRVEDAVTVRNAAGADLWPRHRAPRTWQDTI